jgi:hypothetical protein
VSSWDFRDLCALKCLNNLVLRFYALLSLNPSSLFIFSLLLRLIVIDKYTSVIFTYVPKTTSECTTSEMCAQPNNYGELAPFCLITLKAAKFMGKKCTRYTIVCSFVSKKCFANIFRHDK